MATEKGHLLAGNASETYTPEDLVTGSKQRVTGPVVVSSGEGVVAKNTVMGRTTATGEMRVCDTGNVDGSEVPYCILADGVDATSADAQAGAYFEGQFNPDELVTDASVDLDLAVIKEALQARNIYLRRPGN